jgi:hypothetical protein
MEGRKKKLDSFTYVKENRQLHFWFPWYWVLIPTVLSLVCILPVSLLPYNKHLGVNMLIIVPEHLSQGLAYGRYVIHICCVPECLNK